LPPQAEAGLRPRLPPRRRTFFGHVVDRSRGPGAISVAAARAPAMTGRRMRAPCRCSDAVRWASVRVFGRGRGWGRGRRGAFGQREELAEVEVGPEHAQVVDELLLVGAMHVRAHSRIEALAEQELPVCIAERHQLAAEVLLVREPEPVRRPEHLGDVELHVGEGFVQRDDRHVPIADVRLVLQDPVCVQEHQMRVCAVVQIGEVLLQHCDPDVVEADLAGDEGGGVRRLIFPVELHVPGEGQAMLHLRRGRHAETRLEPRGQRLPLGGGDRLQALAGGDRELPRRRLQAAGDLVGELPRGQRACRRGQRARRRGQRASRRGLLFRARGLHGQTLHRPSGQAPAGAGRVQLAISARVYAAKSCPA
jgi:hypothetical protein